MREEIKSILDSESLPSFLFWLSILNYFEKHKDDLTLEELRALADASERCRNFWNEDKVKEETIYKNGKHVTQEVRSKGLGIGVHDVNPDIVAYLKQVEQKEIEDLAKQVAEMPPPSNDPREIKEWAHKLAADLTA